MPRLLVKVKKANWLKSKKLEEGDVPGDCLQDLRIKDNELSVWKIEADNSNLNRVMTALAANHESITTFDFLLFDEAVIATLGLKMNVTVGKTPDREASSRWHRDIIGLSGKKALSLVVAIFDSAEWERFWEPQVSESLKNALSLGHIDRESLNAKLAAKLAPEPTSGPTSNPSATPVNIPKIKTKLPIANKKDKPVGFMKMCREIVSFSRGAWRRYRNR